jgi:IPTL-CTERM motif
MRTTVGLLLGVVATGAFAQANSILFTTIPTLDDLGLVVLVVMVGVVGGWIMRRRK